MLSDLNHMRQVSKCNIWIHIGWLQKMKKMPGMGVDNVLSNPWLVPPFREDLLILSERNITFISKWLRKSIKQYENFNKSLEGLKTFFIDAKERFSQKNMTVGDDKLENSDVSKEDLTTLNQDMLNKGSQKRHNQKINPRDDGNGRNGASDKKKPTAKTGRMAQLSTAERKDHASLPHSKPQESSQAEASFQPNENNFSTYGENIDLQFSSRKDPRWSGALSFSSSNCSSDHCAARENPARDGNVVGYRNMSKDENSHSSRCQASSSFLDQVSFHSATTTNSSTVITEGTCTFAVTPERKVTADVFNMEKESFFSSSTCCSNKGAPECDIWCEEDGCVFRKVFCPFCSTSNICLGLQVLATDASNTDLLNKVIFCVNRLEIKDHEAMIEDSPMNDSGPVESSSLTSIEKFIYVPPSNNTDGWITTKSKLRLPKREPIGYSSDQGGSMHRQLQMTETGP
ncbi:hypothetical protein ACLOJK_018426 [Asimina triloba]